MNSDCVAAWEAFRAEPTEGNFNQLYDCANRLVYTLCYRILRNEDDALDAFQSFFCRLVVLARGSAARKLEAEEAICQMAAREAEAAKKRRSRRERKEIPEQAGLKQPDPTPPPDRVAADNETRGKVEALVDALPDRYRLPLLLHYFHGMTHREIAAALNKSASTIAYRIQKGLNRLRHPMRQAGLGDSAAVLGLVAAGSAWLEPPASAAASALYANAIAAAHAATTTGALVAVKTWFDATVLSAKGVIVAATIALASAAALLLMESDWSDKSDGSSASRPAAASQAVLAETKSDRKTPSPTGAGAPGPAAGAARLAGTVGSAGLDRGASLRPSTPELVVNVIWADDRQPVAGATVRLDKMAGQGGIGDGSVQETTDDRGKAILRLPQPWGRGYLRISHPEGAPYENAAQIPQKTESGPGTLVVALSRAGAVSGRVWIASTGQPAAGARVVALGCDPVDQPPGDTDLLISLSRILGEASADESGAFQIDCIRPGRASVYAEQGPLCSCRKFANFPAVDIKAGSTAGPIDLMLAPGGLIRGVVRDVLTQGPIPSASVGCRSGGVSRQATTDGIGAYCFEGLPLEALYVSAEAEGHIAKTITVFAAEATESRGDIALEPGSDVDVLVSEANGQPAEGALVSSERSAKTAKTDGSGHARIGPASRLKPERIYAWLDQRFASGFPEFLAVEPTGRISLVLADASEEKTESGAFQGKVTDPEGQPIAGAAVAWAPVLRLPTEPESTTQTDQNGAYQLTVPISRNESPRSLVAFAEGHAPAWRSKVAPGSVRSPRVIDFVLEPSHWIRGVLIDRQGSPVSGIQILAESSGVALGAELRRFKGLSATTDSSGRFEITGLPGPEVALLICSMGGGREVVGVDREVRLTLRPPGMIRGRVLDRETQQPIPAFTVSYAHKDVIHSQGAWPEHYSDPDGRFQSKMELATTGEWSVAIEAEGYEPYLEFGVHALPAEEAQNKTYSLSRKSVTIRGVVADAASGQPLNNVSVYHAFYCEDNVGWQDLTVRPYGGPQGVSSQLTGADGAFAFEESSGRPGTLFAQAGGYGRAMIAPGDRQAFQRPDGLWIPLTPDAAVYGTIFDANGQPSAQKEVYLDRLEQASQGAVQYRLSETSDAVGGFHFAQLAQGQYRLYIQHYTYAGSFRLLERQFDLGASETKYVNLGDEMGPLALRGRTLTDKGEALPRATITLRPLFACPYTQRGAISDGEGLFDIAGLYQGEYEATLTAVDLGGTARTQTERILITGNETRDFPFTMSSPTSRRE